MSNKKKSIAFGKSLRENVPRESHADWEPTADRPDPVELLRSQGKTRVQELLPLRYERMSASAFTFYRGAALIMASDLSTTPTTGISQVVLSRIETGAGNPTLALLEEIASALGTTLQVALSREQHGHDAERCGQSDNS